MDSEQIVAPEALEQTFDPAPAQHEQEGGEHEHEEEAGAHGHDQKGGGEKGGGEKDVGFDIEGDRRATALKGTKHRKATLEMGTQIGADGKPTGAPQAHKEAKVADATRVQIVAAKGTPLVKAHGDTPAESDIFTRPASGGTKVTHRSGSVATPNVKPAMKPDNLFIDGGPKAQDVRQGGLGNCFFQSCLLAITQNDPGKINSIMSFSGHDVSVTLQYVDKKTGLHKPKTIKTSTALLTQKASDGTIELRGAGMRIADNPDKVEWWAETHGNTVQVHRRDTYETALWAPMMEKAHADFAQHHGSDGAGLTAEDKKLKSGYKIVDAGGNSEDCYQLFYGDAATGKTMDMAFTPGSNIVTDNIAGIQQLLRYEAQKGNTAPGSKQMFMHARIGSNGAVTRGDALIDQVNGMLWSEQFLDDLGAALAGETQQQTIQRLLRTVDRTLLRNALNTLQTTLKGFLASPATATDSDVAKAAGPVQTPDVFPHLWDDTLPAPFKHLRENLGILINLGDDSSPGRRQNYTSHAYQVKTVTLADTHGSPLTLTAGDLPARAAEIDPVQSTVLMHNPHATNEPDLKGNGPADGVDDGMFTYTLDQFLRNFDRLRFATVDH